MDRGVISINKNFELEYRYYDKNTKHKYFNRKFEIYVLEKKSLRKNYVMHMDNSDPRQMMPGIFTAKTGKKRYEFGVTTLNWNDIKTKFSDFVISELGEKQRNNVKKAFGQLSSPKL